MTPEQIEAIVNGITSLLTCIAVITFFACLFFGGPLLEHRREMKKLDIERIREQRLLVEAQNASKAA